MSSTTMQDMPMTASHGCVLCMSLKMLFQVCTKVVPEAIMPRTSLTCEVTMIRAQAEVNPEDTGPDTKSIRNPTRRRSIITF